MYDLWKKRVCACVPETIGRVQAMLFETSASQIGDACILALKPSVLGVG
jgi:hypothetical protein